MVPPIGGRALSHQDHLDMATDEFGLGKHKPLHPLTMLRQVDRLEHEVVVCVCVNIMRCWLPLGEVSI